jgi:iron complex outermembrane receptor protein
MRNRQIGRAFFGLSVAAMALCAAPAAAQEAAPRQYQLSGQALGSALRTVSVLSGQAIVAPSELVAGKTSRPLMGTYSTEDAVARLLDGSGLVAVQVGNALVIRRQSAESAQDAQGDGEGVGGEAILVTGTRIRGRAPAGASVITIDRKAIDQSGYATTQQILQALPQNFGGGPNEGTSITGRGNAEANATSGSAINLRGLGASSTLVLFDGERPAMAGSSGRFVDLSLIPTSAIERIEVLADGASALYGSDAVAGVVNIIPRKNFNGLELSGRAGFGDGFDEQQLSGLLGIGRGRAHLVIGYEFYRRSALATADRPYYSEDLRRYGLGDFRSGPGIPGTIYAADGSEYAIPGGQNGTALTPGQLVPGAGPASDLWAGADALPAQRRHAVYASARFSPTDSLEFYAQGLFGHREYSRHERDAFNAVVATVPVTNPFYVDPIGTNEPVDVSYDFRKEVGVEYTHGSAQNLGGSAGLRWSLGAWQLDLHATYGEQEESLFSDNLVNTARLAAALADTDPATALNLFGDGTANNPATIAKLRGSDAFSTRYAIFAQQIRIDGPLFDLGAGNVRLAMGAEHRRERYFDRGERDDISELLPVDLPTFVDATRHVVAGYAELSVPLSTADGRGLHVGALDVSAAIRGEHYSDFGGTVNPKVGASWSPIKAVRLRGSFGTSFRAPSFQDMRQDAASKSYFAYPIPDPSSPTGRTNALILAGNDPDMGPERATSWTVGLDFRPNAPRGPQAQVTYFDVAYRDRIANPASALLIFFTNRAVYAPIIDTHPDPAVVAAYFASPYYARYTSLTPADVTAIINATNQNLAEQRQRGLDFDIGYESGVAGGTAELGLSGTYLIGYSQKLTATSPAAQLVGTIGNPTDLRLRGRLLFQTDRFGAAMFVNYVDGYTNNSRLVARPVGSWTTVDLQLSAKVADFRVALTASNLLDTDPPHTAYGLSTTTLGFDLENANPLGRVFGIQVTRQW